MKTPPEIFVLSGPNGAGKSTVAQFLLPERLGIERFMNADLIARGLSPLSPEKSAIEAGRIMIRRMRQFRDEQVSFGFETTLATQSHARFLQEAQALGFAIHILFVYLQSADLACSRVATRVSRGGHLIDAAVVRRRYDRGLRNLFRLYIQLADAWSIWDNSGDRLELVARSSTEREDFVAQASIYDDMKRRAHDI